MSPIACNSCGQILPESIVPHIGDSALDPSDIEKELVRVKAQIRKLLDRQAGLLRHHNRHSSPISTLPPEILSVIFRFACTPETAFSGDHDDWLLPSNLSNYQAITLSSVSSHWRQVALSTTELWSTITVNFNSSKRMTKVHAALLQHHLKHTNTLALSISDTMKDTSNTSNHRKHIISILSSSYNIHKITTLHIVKGPAHKWLATISQLPQIQDLVLRDFNGLENPKSLVLDLHTMRSLRRVHIIIRGVNWERVRLPSSVRVVRHIVTCPRTLLPSLHPSTE